MGRSKVQWWLLPCAASCTQSYYVELQVESPTAVGAKVESRAERRTCPDCTGEQLDVDSAIAEPGGVFEVSSAGELRAIGEGTVTATFVVDGYTFERELTALTANRITMIPRLRVQPCAAPVLYTVGARVEVPFELHHDDTPLHGRDFHPFVVSNGILAGVDEDATEPILRMGMPDMPISTTLTARGDPSFLLPIDVIDRTRIDALALSRSGDPLIVSGTTKVDVDLLASGRLVCGDALMRTVKIDTTGVCVITGDDGVGGVVSTTAISIHEVTVRGVAMGTCTLTVTLAGTPLTTTTSFEVM